MLCMRGVRVVVVFEICSFVLGRDFGTNHSLSLAQEMHPAV